MNQFQIMSGSTVRYIKIKIYCCGMPSDLMLQLSSVMELRLGTLPIGYLGVPFISGKLSQTDRIPLIDKITVRISSWSSRFLSFAGRFQLISSVLTSLYSYWCTVFLLPKRVIAHFCGKRSL